MTNEEFARSLGFSSTYLYKVRKHGTPDRELAEKLAEHFGKKVSDFFRRPGQRGRPRVAVLPFRQFIRETVAVDEDGDEDEETNNLISVPLRIDLSLMYMDDNLAPPGDFESLEALHTFLRLNRIGEDHSAAAVLMLWKAFKLWRVRKVCDQIAFDIEVGDDVDDDVIRALLALAERANITN